MRTLKTVLLSVAMIGLFVMWQVPSQELSPVEDSSAAVKEVNIYYFHNTRRCATCSAIEKVAQETIDKHFADRKKAGTITFQSLNIEKEEGKKVGDKIGVTEQSLVLTNGSKTMDLTNQAFMYARSKPEKLQSTIKAAVKNLSK
jgi:hypothetical protein